MFCFYVYKNIVLFIYYYSIGTTLPTLQELYSSRVSERAVKITLDPHIQHTPSLNCYRLVDATEHWAPERSDTETVSSLRQSSHEYLILNMEHTTLLYITYLPHILIFSFHICTYQTCTHIIVYIIYCVFAILYIAYLYIVLLSSVFCHCHSVALWSFCHYYKFLIYIYII